MPFFNKYMHAVVGPLKSTLMLSKDAEALGQEDRCEVPQARTDEVLGVEVQARSDEQLAAAEGASRAELPWHATVLRNFSWPDSSEACKRFGFVSLGRILRLVKAATALVEMHQRDDLLGQRDDPEQQFSNLRLRGIWSFAILLHHSLHVEYNNRFNVDPDGGKAFMDSFVEYPKIRKFRVGDLMLTPIACNHFLQCLFGYNGGPFFFNTAPIKIGPRYGERKTFGGSWFFRTFSFALSSTRPL